MSQVSSKVEKKHHLNISTPGFEIGRSSSVASCVDANARRRVGLEARVSIVGCREVLINSTKVVFVSVVLKLRSQMDIYFLTPGIHYQLLIEL